MSIRFDHLTFSYFEDRKPVLPAFSGEFDAGEITLLTGASGCGKSTLLYLAAGIYPHGAGFVLEGKVTVEGQDPGSMTPPERCRLVGMMFQNPELQFCMDTVKNELIFCLENICTPPEKMEERLDEALSFCDIRHLKERKLLSLSGGERQKVMLACLTAIGPKWLLLDEPFANIDNQSARDIAAKLGQLHRERGVGILAVDHRLDNWLEVADTVRIMEGGTLLPDRLDPRHLDRDRLEQLGVIVPGGGYDPQLPPAQPGAVALELKHLSLGYGQTQVLRDVNAVFHRGCIYAVVGQSGCGKSSLFGALSGLCRYQGEALLEGRSLKKLRKADIGKIGFVTQNPQDQFVSSAPCIEEVSHQPAVKWGPGAPAAEARAGAAPTVALWRYRDLSPYTCSARASSAGWA